jgi:hypothetical protein
MIGQPTLQEQYKVCINAIFNTIGDESLSMRTEHCKNNCRYRCDFDHGSSVFCHALGRDLVPIEIKLLEQVGCRVWSMKSMQEDLIDKRGRGLAWER